MRGLLQSACGVLRGHSTYRVDAYTRGFGGFRRLAEKAIHTFIVQKHVCYGAFLNGHGEDGGLCDVSSLTLVVGTGN